MIGINFPADMRLSPGFAQLLGARWIRVVLLPHVDLTEWIQEAHRRGLKVLGVIARESLDPNFEAFAYTAAMYAERYGSTLDAIQGGNEADHESPSSWTMEQGQLNNLLFAINQHFPETTIVGPGLVSGNPHYLDAVDLDLIDYVAVHGYGTRPSNIGDWSELPGNFGTIGELLDRYRYHGKNFWLTEIGLSTHEVSEEFQARYLEEWFKAVKLRTDVETAFWFCADDNQV